MAMCTICMDGLNTKYSTVSTSCGHIFHEKCINEWFDSSASCPKCRKIIGRYKIHKIFLDFGDAPLGNDGMKECQVTANSGTASNAEDSPNRLLSVNAMGLSGGRVENQLPQMSQGISDSEADFEELLDDTHEDYQAESEDGVDIEDSGDIYQEDEELNNLIEDTDVYESYNEDNSYLDECHNDDNSYLDEYHDDYSYQDECYNDDVLYEDEENW